MSVPLRRFLFGYGVALVCLVVATGVGVSLNVQDLPVFGLFLVAIAISGRFGGLGPALLALIAGGVLASYVLTDWPPNLLSSEVQIRLGVYTVLGMIIILLTHSEHTIRSALVAEQDILRETIEQQERERRLIAYDIHDGTIQYATAALMFLEGYLGKHRQDVEAEEINPVVTAIRHTIEEGRRVMNGIRSPVLDDAGVVAAIDQLIAQEKPQNLEIEFEPQGEVGRFTPEVETALFRITQEIVNNALKHSGSPRLRIGLAMKGDRIRLTAQDWGVGFVPQHQARSVHGLRGIRERVVLLKGHFKCESAPGQGTRFEIELPATRP